MKKFTKNTEDFVCEKCGKEIKGDGYTNHCPDCLWSKHVDNNPGDRACDCEGMMEPFRIEKEGSGYILTHRCTKCNHVKRNKIHTNDDFDEVVKVSKKMEG